MTHCSPNFLDQLTFIVGENNVKTAERALKSGSRDCFHFSPVLKPQLEDSLAEAIVFPETQDQLIALIALAYKEKVPITPRGGGTGNYGQGVPMDGGLMINTRRMNRIIELTAEKAHVEAGTNLWTVERESAAVGAELRMFPSTIGTSTAAGFITGGSGGIGSVSWGMLRDADNILHARIVTVEEQPKVIDLTSPEQLADVLHNCGLTAFVTEVTFALAPKTDWHQHIYAFDDFESALQAGQDLANDSSLKKRLTTVFEWPIPSYFMPLVRRDACPDGKSLLFLISDRDPDQLAPLMSQYQTSQTFHLPPSAAVGINKGFQIYDFTWNHTTQWAMKANPNLTYLQDAFDPERVFSQLRERKERYGDQIHTHIEFIKTGEGTMLPAGLSLLDYRSKDQLWEIIEYCESKGIRISNPHTHFLDDDNRWYGDNFLSAKQRWDPAQLLNPGHLKSLEKDRGAASSSGEGSSA